MASSRSKIMMKNAGILFFQFQTRSSGKGYPYIFLIKENSGRWNIPVGGIHRGEAPFVAALREFSEETGIKRSDIPMIDRLGDRKEYPHVDLIESKTRIYFWVVPADKKLIVYNGPTKETMDGRWVRMDGIDKSKLRYGNRMEELFELIVYKWLSDRKSTNLDESSFHDYIQMDGIFVDKSKSGKHGHKHKDGKKLIGGNSSNNRTRYRSKYRFVYD